MYLDSITQTKNQPSGQIIKCLASGNHHFNYLHDKNGYIIVQDYETGYYTYANYKNNDLISTKYIATQEVLELDDCSTIYDNLVTINDIDIQREYQRNVISERLVEDEVNLRTPTTGQINNIVIYVRFKDEKEFEGSQIYYDELFNNETPNTVSMYNYFKSVSYNKLFIKSHFYPLSQSTAIISYQEPQEREYYEVYNPIVNPTGYQPDERWDREYELVTNAIQAVRSQISPTLNIDSNNDGYVDNVTLIIKGTPTAQGNILWPHKSNLKRQNVTINNKIVDTYVINLETETIPSVVCHEMMHTISKKNSPEFPDLYHVIDELLKPRPVWTWDIMAKPLDTPQQCCAYLKYAYGGWINEIPSITLSGRYTLNPLTLPNNNAYSIYPKESSGEYFVLEYRNKNTLFDSTIYQSGLLVYRINPKLYGRGNRLGPPNEVYVYRPGGKPGDSFNDEGAIELAALSVENGRTSIGGPDNPLFLSDGTPTDIIISNIGIAGDTISFDISGIAQSNLIITKYGPDTVSVGEEFEYNINVLNNGETYSSYPTIITDIIPDNLEIISLQSNRGEEFIEGQTVKIELDTIFEGKDEEIKVKAIKEGTITNTALVEAENNQNPIKSSSKKTVIKSGQQIKYTTGTLTNMCNNASVTISSDNKNNVEYELKFSIRNLDNSSDTREYTLKIGKDTDNTIRISKLPRIYEIIFDNIADGIDILIIEYCGCTISKLIREVDLKPTN